MNNNEKQIRAEGWTAAEFQENKKWYEKWHGQHYYNLELLEVEERRRKQLMVPSAVA